jgi:hypothetical protein
MSDLLALALEAHGGIQRWQELKSLRVSAAIGGAMWGLKGQSGILNQVTAQIDCRQQHVVYQPFTAPNRRGIFEPQRVAIEDTAGQLVAERRDPLQSFAGHGPQTPWDELDTAYFAGYALWGYMTAPFHFLLPGIVTEELTPWPEDGQTWRRLQVSYPPHLAVHSPVQTYYFSQDGLLQRVDYHVAVMDGIASAQYVSEHRTFDGIVFPTRRRVYPRQPDGAPMRERVGVAIDISSVQATELADETIWKNFG